MSTSNTDTPDTTSLCGTFASLTDEQRDQGRAFSQPIVQSCAKPVVTIAGEASVSFVNDLPIFAISQ